MRRQICIALGTALFALPVVASAAASFSGSWVKDNSKSDPVPNLQYWLTREPDSGGAGGGRGGRGGRGGPGAGPVPMMVQQDGNSLQISDAQGARKYMLDGKPHAHPTDTGVEKAQVTANMQGDTLVIQTTQPWGGMPGNVPLEIKEVWSLSPDGKTLTISTMRSSPAEKKSFKQVYERK